MFRSTNTVRAAHRNLNARLGVETLEDRLALSWAGIPPARITLPASVRVTINSDGEARGQAAITRNENDFYSFTAPRTGTYRIVAWNTYDALDTVLGVFNNRGQRIAYNDDANEENLYSDLTVDLQAGQRYWFGITNYTRTPNGPYNWYVAAPEDAGGGGGGGGGGGSDWFAQNLSDAGLAQVARNLFADQRLDRNDWLAVFQQARADGTVTANEFSDLQTLVRNAASLGTPDHVRNLANKVVNGDAANARYAGASLGNLRAGSAGSVLEKLTNKWFLGLDRPVAKSGSTTFSYQVAAGSLFVGGASYSDVRQGMVGNCYLLAGLAEVAFRTPERISDMFIDNGDGTFTVRFFNNGTPDYVTVDRALPVNSSGRFVFANMGGTASSSSNELWVALAEKAYCQINESGWLRAGGILPGNGVNSYQATAGGWGGQAVQQVVGITARLWNNLSFNGMVNAWNNGNYLTLGSKGSSDTMMDGNGVVQRHAYAVVGYEASTQKFTVYNPWGLNNGSAPGLLSLTWTQMAQSFESYDFIVRGGREQAPANQDALALDRTFMAESELKYNPPATPAREEASVDAVFVRRNEDQQTKASASEVLVKAHQAAGHARSLSDDLFANLLA